MCIQRRGHKMQIKQDYEVVIGRLGSFSSGSTTNPIWHCMTDRGRYIMGFVVAPQLEDSKQW